MATLIATMTDSERPTMPGADELIAVNIMTMPAATIFPNRGDVYCGKKV